MRLFDPFSYYNIHLLIVTVFSVIYYFSISRMGANSLLNRKTKGIEVFLYLIVFTVVVGLRPVSPAFGDTVNYAQTYYALKQISFVPELSSDPLFHFFMWWCSQRMEVEWFFLIIEVLYIIPVAWACKRLLGNNADLAILFCFAAFSFFSYGVNGIRNGAACSLVVLAMAFLQGGKIEKLLFLLLSLVAFYTHASTALPILCLIAARFVKSPYIMFSFWIIAIIMSLLGGDFITNIFANLGFDERLSDYISDDADESVFSRTGFRWDFLLYSAVPILLGYIVIFVKKVYDPTYLLLLGTYIYANAFWIMVIRAAYSNRFAYLSWFLYPIVLCYPLLKLEIWPKSQGQKTGIIMLGHLAFTLIMAFLF